MRICVIFNPAARGNKARHFRHHLDALSGQAAFKATAAPGDGRRLAAEAVADGFEIVAAAGGDGTVNEVINGLADAPDGLNRARLGVLPLGTVNVFARELRIPLRLESAWRVLQGGREMRLDLPRVDFSENGTPQKKYFAQLAGVGFDARAIELVDWPLKKKIGPLAYVAAGLKALRERQPAITLRANGQVESGELVLAGNGHFYGGPFTVFPPADLCDGVLEICVFPRVRWGVFFRCLPDLLLRRRLPASVAKWMRADTFAVSCETQAAFELDGEWAGHLPATFSIECGRLRVMVPG